uniref:VWFA domain-containing protein n=1 Tax=Alexandrium monilatum TaxID=311494 RepID=A0A7S4SCK4_9DINO
MMGPPSAASDGGRRIRLNVSATLDNEAASKFLVVVGEHAGMQELVAKIQQALHKQGLNLYVGRLLNGLRAVLPDDEAVGDVLRDSEEITAVLSATQRPARPLAVSCQATRMESTQLPAGSSGSATLLPPGPAETLPVSSVIRLPQEALDADSSDSEEGQEDAAAAVAEGEGEEVPPRPVEEDYPPLPVVRPGVPEGADLIPGPSEALEAEQMPYEVIQVDHPCDPLPPPTTYDSDWLAENLTPKLREFVYSHRQEDRRTEPKYVPSIGKFVGARFYDASGAFVSVFMRPQTACGSDPSATMPVHYHIAKSDLLCFQRRVEGQIERIQQHLDLFKASMRGLKSLLDKGMSEGDHVNVMLPQSYQVFEEVEASNLEADRPLLPKIGGSRPVLLVDTSGDLGRHHLPYVKGALKRALHAHLPAKTSFQFVRFAALSGEPRPWATEMAPPTKASLQAAEEWIDGLAPVSSGRLLDGLRCALAHDMCDEVVLISSAETERMRHDDVLSGVRAINTREVAIDTVGIDPEPHGELLLRNIAERNHGDFMLKTFGGQKVKGAAYCSQDAKWTSWRTNLVTEKTKQLSDSFKKQKMSIGSQLGIIEVMQREEAQREVRWRDEWRCAQRLIVSSEVPKEAPLDRDGVKELERRTARTVKERVGGGFLYQTDELDLGLERLFEHKSTVPWTEHSDTVAAGPKVFVGEPSQPRVPRRLPVGPGDGVSSHSSCSLEAPPRPPLRLSRAGTGSSRSSGASCATGAQNPWGQAGGSCSERLRRQTPQRASRSRGHIPRAASADRAAGVAAPPRRSARSKTPPARRPPATAGRSGAAAVPAQGPFEAPPEAAAPLAPPPPPPRPVLTPGPATPPAVERRWSF